MQCVLNIKKAGKQHVPQHRTLNWLNQDELPFQPSIFFLIFITNVTVSSVNANSHTALTFSHEKYT